VHHRAVCGGVDRNGLDLEAGQQRANVARVGRVQQLGNDPIVVKGIGGVVLVCGALERRRDRSQRANVFHLRGIATAPHNGHTLLHFVCVCVLEVVVVGVEKRK